MNKCVFDKLGLEKVIPGAPADEVPVHLRQKQIFATLPQDDKENRWYMRKRNPTEVLDQSRLRQEVTDSVKAKEGA